ncbi:MAG: hypothetical protein JNM14_14825 [Ferruginibacter sp.]|nr:hypothetical protein [Ferruginibacter sp.]
MKKKLFITAITAMMLVAISSCKKDDCPAPTYPIEGYWVGKYGSGTSTPSAGYSMVIEPGGTVTVADGATITASSKAAGTWTLTGNVFKATYTYSTPGGSTFSIQATWTNDGKLTSGTYGSGSNTSGGGTWFMDRKN